MLRLFSGNGPLSIMNASATRYLIAEGTLEECIRKFISKPASTHHLYENHTAPLGELITAVVADGRRKCRVCGLRSVSSPSSAEPSARWPSCSSAQPARRQNQYRRRRCGGKQILAGDEEMSPIVEGFGCRPATSARHT